MQNVIIDSGIIPHSWVKKAVSMSSYNVYFVGDDKDIDELKRDVPEVRAIKYSELANRNNFAEIETIRNKYNVIFNAIISDNRTVQISERTFTTLKPWDNHFFSQLPILSKMICDYIDYLDEINPEFVFFHAAPHNLYSYTFGKVAELMGIKVYLSKTTALPWKSTLVRGIDEQKPLAITNRYTEDVNERLEGYFLMNSQKYDEAIPSYEKERIEARKGKLWSWKTELKEALQSPHRIVAVLRKYELYKYYQSHSSSDINVGKYVAVFLHFQPERTSLPEGYCFTQQAHLIRTLSLGIPADYTILVKEHPSMFVGSLDIRYRNKLFYEEIASMNNVKLVDIGVDSFTLTDNAKCIATITGTVGVQALIRGRAVMAFGVAAYRDFKYCYQIKDVADVIRSMEEIDQLDSKIVTNEFKNYLINCSTSSVNGVDDEMVDNIDYYNQSYRLNADGKVLYSLLCDEFEV